MSHELTAYLSVSNLFKINELWPHYQKDGNHINNFESHNSLKLSFTNIQGIFCSNFVEYESFLESNSPDILALSETKFSDSIDSMRGYLSLIQRDSITHMHGLAD